MKKLINSISILFILAVSVVTNSCQDPVEGYNFKVSNNFFKNLVSFEFINANPNSSRYHVSGIEVSFVGEDADKVYTLAGKRNFQPDRGFMDVGIAQNAEYSVADPLRFAIVVKGTGYLSTMKEVVINSEDDLNIEVRVVQLNDLPDGLTLGMFAGELGADGLSESRTIELADGTTLTMNQGTKMFDRAGNEITGRVEGTMVVFDPLVEESLAAYPGGLMANRVVDNISGSGLDGPTTFATLGFFSLDILSESGQEVKTFDQPLIAGLKFHRELLNPATDEPLKAGDLVPFYSLELETGVWDYEEGFAIVDNGGEKLEGTVELNHLTTFNPDFPTMQEYCDFWQQYYPNLPECAQFNSCPEEVTLTFQLDQGDGRTYRVKLYNMEAGAAGVGQQVYNQSFTTADADVADKVINITGLPDTKSMRIEVDRTRCVFASTGGSQATIINQTYNPCDGTSISLDLSDPGYVAPAARTLDVTLQCSPLVKPTAPFYYRLTGQAAWCKLGNMKDGILTTNELEDGNSYDFWVKYDGTIYPFTKSVTSSDTNIVQSFDGGC